MELDINEVPIYIYIYNISRHNNFIINFTNF
uniref:Uncharacterized protein n=1 Tax=viral metagenome TaxID=1070528 RepID=A0A6C0H8U6_9ZZZZ